VNALALFPEERREKRKGNQLSRWLTSPPEAGFFWPFFSIEGKGA